MIMILWLWCGSIIMHFFLFKGKSKDFLAFSFFFLFMAMVWQGLEMSSESSILYMGELSLTFLTLWLFILCSISCHLFLFKKKESLLTLMSLLMLTIFLVFSSKEYFSFYFWFELGVLPISFIILLGSSSKYRLEASFYLLLFTVASALLLFFNMFILIQVNETHSFFFYQNMMNISKFGTSWMEYFIFLSSSAAFLVKFPMFMVHIWLPKAHVEAPVMGSMILAGVLLKLGGIGFIIFKKIFIINGDFLFFIFIIFFLWGSCLVGWICFYQNDSKVLIAFSSVNHMTMVIMSLMYGSQFSIMGGMLIMIGHGLVSSLLFFLISMPYSQSSSRNFFSMGQVGMNSLIALFWILGLLINMGFPPFINFLGEVFILTLLLSNPALIFFFFCNFFVGALYTFSIMSNVLQKKKNYFLMSQDSIINVSSFFSLFLGSLHLLPLFFFFNMTLFF
uniref:NADH-ubiquinone oxidoreductase chain 4 n=1 Tax=Baltalimania ylvae TaxID=3341436 RepID=A0A1X9WD84_9BILA|nr:NADH dehydrogenase subunit 4 [Archaphanostoma ylvae]ARS00892.1 NADH dehydrogenase subunit 4 [Archaphanostoma ylvae]